MKGYVHRGNVTSLALLTILGLPVHAGQPPLKENGEINLGPITGFSDEAAALAACKPDGVVCADSDRVVFPKVRVGVRRDAERNIHLLQAGREVELLGHGPGVDDD